MKLFKVRYTDPTVSARNERFETKPYAGSIARTLADNLAVMGCKDFEFVPVKET